MKKSNEEENCRKTKNNWSEKKWRIEASREEEIIIKKEGKLKKA